MAYIESTVKLSYTISPPATDSPWGSHYSKYGIGGLQQVADSTQRDSIPLTRLMTGSIAYVTDQDKYYKWSNSTWNQIIPLSPDVTFGQSYYAGNGLNLNSNTFSIDLSGSNGIAITNTNTISVDLGVNKGLEFDDGKLRIKLNGSSLGLNSGGIYVANVPSHTHAYLSTGGGNLYGPLNVRANPVSQGHKEMLNIVNLQDPALPIQSVIANRDDRTKYITQLTSPYTSTDFYKLKYYKDENRIITDQDLVTFQNNYGVIFDLDNNGIPKFGIHINGIGEQSLYSEKQRLLTLKTKKGTWDKDKFTAKVGYPQMLFVDDYNGYNTALTYDSLHDIFHIGCYENYTDMSSFMPFIIFDRGNSAIKINDGSSMQDVYHTGNLPDFASPTHTHTQYITSNASDTFTGKLTATGNGQISGSTLKISAQQFTGSFKGDGSELTGISSGQTYDAGNGLSLLTNTFSIDNTIATNVGVTSSFLRLTGGTLTGTLNVSNSIGGCGIFSYPTGQFNGNSMTWITNYNGMGSIGAWNNITNTPADIQIGWDASYQPLFMLKANGNIGMGTSSPSTKLQVVGTISASSYIGDGSQLSGINASGGQIYDNGYGLNLDANNTFSVITHTHSANDINNGILDVENGGTGIDGSDLTNDEFITYNGSGYYESSGYNENSFILKNSLIGTNTASIISSDRISNNDEQYISFTIDVSHCNIKDTVYVYNILNSNVGLISQFRIDQLIANTTNVTLIDYSYNTTNTSILYTVTTKNNIDSQDSGIEEVQLNQDSSTIIVPGLSVQSINDGFVLDWTNPTNRLFDYVKIQQIHAINQAALNLLNFDDNGSLIYTGKNNQFVYVAQSSSNLYQFRITPYLKGEQII